MDDLRDFCQAMDDDISLNLSIFGYDYGCENTTSDQHCSWFSTFMYTKHSRII